VFNGPSLAGPPAIDRWYKLRWHAEQYAFVHDPRAFKIGYAGRQSGKTENAKRPVTYEAIFSPRYWGARYIFAAPTLPQAREIYWDDLKAFIPRKLGQANESRLEIRLHNGAKIQVHGMDRPQRIEGPPIATIVLDEYADMRPEAWELHVEPGLTTPGRPGRAIFVGTPDGRNHYYDLVQRAYDDPEWGVYHWTTASINPKAAAAKKVTLDPLTYRQEYEAEFVSWGGAAYYTWDTDVCAAGRIKYRPDLPLIFAHDFNVTPGVALAIQELPAPKWAPKEARGEESTCVVGEVWVEKHSNSRLIADRLLEKYGNHRSTIHLHGDPAGGARSTQATEGTDWDIITSRLERVYGSAVYAEYGSKAPLVRQRVAAMCGRIESADNRRRFFVDDRCVHMIQDLEGTTWEDDGKQLHKPKGTKLTHMTDGAGYYVEQEHPLGADLGTVSW